MQIYKLDVYIVSLFVIKQTFHLSLVLVVCVLSVGHNDYSCHMTSTHVFSETLYKYNDYL